IQRFPLPPSSAPDLVEERRATRCNALRRVQVHGRGPSLPVLPVGLATLRLEPFVESVRFAGLPCRPDAIGEGHSLSFRQRRASGGHERRHVEPTHERPYTTIMVFTGDVVLVVPPSPVGIRSLDARE